MEARRRAANKRRKLKLTGGGIGKNRSRSTETDEEDDEPDEGNYTGVLTPVFTQKKTSCG